jgi:hypothetical protein
MPEQELREQIDRVRTSLEYSASNVHGLPLRDDAMVRVPCRLLREAAALLALLLKDEWRTIESAPRNGTHVILAFGSDGVMEGWWEDADPGAYPWKFVDRGCFTKSPFTAGEYLNGAREVRGGPTHWQPLPAPPTLISQQEAEHG